MRGDEAIVVRMFVTWLKSEGWTIDALRDHWDVIASKNGETLYCEAKGETSEPGLDIHTAYGQIICRQGEVDEQTARYCLVIRDEPRSLRAALRAPARVRTLLRTSIYAVAHDGAVRIV
ncbi:hypothetical protein G7043_18255 [Lentzea sp. NEAU-D13]|uniref:Protein NO VEIN C-terminal domain-containing protein n=1 Tax=Lentzea alba TaxID=2714351 RepID=A0A7C9VWL2_9PSEU|nr:hypothetical protein [Lentzea alba]NGY60878.1 hypothetical protein [Lentzea alba]